MESKQYDFSDIAPYDDSIFKEKMASLVVDPGFLHAVNYTMPKEDVPVLLDEMKQMDNKYDFQHQIMFPFLEMLAKTTTAGISLGGVKYYNPGMNYTFITNHRDIVLDASFLGLALLRRDLPTPEVAIGNNLLVFDWINDLVRLNKSFIVKRNTGLREGLMAAKKLSAYIHHAILEKQESVWIAQREGRAKDLVLVGGSVGVGSVVFTGHHCGVSLALLFDLRAFPGERQIEHADDDKEDGDNTGHYAS